MATNRVQFQRGLPMREFLEHYGTEDGCEEALRASRWPQGFACPVCGGAASCSFRREGRLYWQCASCRHQCSVISGTILESTKNNDVRTCSVIDMSISSIRRRSWGPTM